MPRQGAVRESPTPWLAARPLCVLRSTITPGLESESRLMAGGPLGVPQRAAGKRTLAVPWISDFQRIPCVRLKSISLIRSLRSGRVSDTLCLSGILAVGKQEQPRRIDPGKVALIAVGDHGRDTLRTRRLGQHAEVRQPVHRRVQPAAMRRAVADQLPQDRALRGVGARMRVSQQYYSCLVPGVRWREWK